MTTDGYTLFRKKKFPYHINLPDTPEELQERYVIEYEYMDSKLKEDELPGLPEDFYSHLSLKHKKIKYAQVLQTPLDPEDPDLFYTPADSDFFPEKDGGEGVPSTPASTSSSTPAAANSESSDAGIFEDAEVGEEIHTEKPSGGLTTEDASTEVGNADNSHPL